MKGLHPLTWISVILGRLEELQSLPAVQQCVNKETRLLLTIATTLLREGSPELLLGRKGLP